MKRMLLVSMLQNVTPIIKTVEPNLKNKTITYIPTASRVEKLGFLIRMEKWTLKSLGLIVDELEISTSSYETIKTKLQRNDFIYVTGGNTFYLLQELKRTGADKVIVQEINKGKFYMGESAGAIVTAPDIGYSAEMDRKEKAPGLTEYTGLHAVDFYVVPHYKNREMGEAARKIIAAYTDTLDLKIINDNQAIYVEGNEFKILDK